MTSSIAFESEAAMCAAFLAALPPGWTSYAETAGWDILLVRAADGFQIGVQAKLKLNAAVLNQALEAWGWAWKEAGPDCRAVLVPSGTGPDLGAIADHLAMTVIRMAPQGRGYVEKFSPRLPVIEDDKWSNVSEAWHELCPTARHKLPEYVPDVAAGAAGPIQLTAWKIAAIKIAVLLDRRGSVTRSDFKALKIDPRRWLDGGWLRAEGGHLVRGSLPNFKAQHPKNYVEIEADFPEWSQRLPPRAFSGPAPKQEALL